MIRENASKLMYVIVTFVLLTLLAMGCSPSENAQNSGSEDGSNMNSSSNSSSNSSDTQEGNGNGEDKIELRFAWWGSQDRHDRTLEVIDLYEQQNPNVTISPEFSGWGGYWDKLATQAAGGNAPDIVQMSISYLSEYAHRGLVEDLGVFVDEGLLDLSDVDESFLSGGRVDGVLYALNIGANALAIAIDPAMFEEAGIPIPEPGYTWEEFVDMARQLKAGLGDVYVTASTNRDGFQFYARGHGKELYNEDGTAIGFDEQTLTDFLSMMKTLLDEGVLAPVDVLANVQGLEDSLIVHHRAPNQDLWSNQIVALTEAANRPLKMIMTPIVEGEGDNKSYYIRPSQLMSVMTGSEHPEEAAKFVDFFTNSLEANDILGGERGIPISSKVREHLYPSLNDASKEMFDFIETISPYSSQDGLRPAGDGAVTLAFDRHFEAMAYGQVTPEEAAQNFIKEANEILAGE